MDAQPSPRDHQRVGDIDVDDPTDVALVQRSDRESARRRVVVVTGAVVLAAAGVAAAVVDLVGHDAGGATQSVSAGGAPGVQVPPGAASVAPLTAGVMLSRTTIHLGESVVVSYTWSDGNGELVSLGHVGPSAMKVVRPPACTFASTAAPTPIGAKGSWVFTPQRGLYVGPVTLPARVQVGIDVVTGGCAPTEHVVATQWLTILPP